MKTVMATLFFIACGMTFAHAAQNWMLAYHPVKGRYTLYGGGLGDPRPPTSKDKRIAFWIHGRAAKQMFNAMGPDLRNVCGADDGQRMRQRAQLSCSYSRQDGHRCNFGFDLLSGQSIEGAIC